MKYFRKNIFWSLGALALISSLIAMGLATFLLLHQEEREAMARIVDEEKNLVSLGITDFISLAEYRQFIDQISENIPQDQLNEVIHIYEPPGILLYSNQSQQKWRASPSELGKHVNRGFYEIHQGNREYLAKLHGYETLDGKTLWLQIATPRTTPWTTLRSVAGLFSLALLGLIGLSILFSYWLGRKMTYPIESFAQEISRLDTKAVKTWTSLPADYADILEMKPIVSSFNKLIDRLQQTFVRNEYLGRFIAHEIQTPLTVIQGEVEMALTDPDRKAQEKALKESVLEEVNKISDVMDTVLKVPYGDRNSTPIQIEVLDLRDLMKATLEKIKTSIARGIQLDFEDSFSSKIRTDHHLFSLLLGNLIRNADRHTPSDKLITIRCYRELQQAVIEIVDQGKGLPQSILEAVNADDAFSSELGIGLILIKQIVDLLQHKVIFQNMDHGHGLKVRIFASIAD